jgi:hypothetical protein
MLHTVGFLPEHRLAEHGEIEVFVIFLLVQHCGGTLKQAITISSCIPSPFILLSCIIK